MSATTREAPMRAVANLTFILVASLAGAALAQQQAPQPGQPFQVPPSFQPPPGFKPPEMTEDMKKMLEERTKRQKELFERQRQAEDAKWPALQAAIFAPTAASPWLEKERGFLLDLLAFAKPKVVVMPPVVPDGAMGIDISGRITMARQ